MLFVFVPYDYPLIPYLVQPFSKTNDQDIVLFCGSPGAGKSTFYWKYLEPLGYERVNQDTLKTVRITNLHIAVCKVI